ncbi:MAG: succinate dehydrogenase [Chlamydiae bacterium CG10_big_fil_rev_8_21_14_0_10_35_9]|nr:MAG: succinate dehydrogenase [Chlamydiae bacterium CG10_big_fil_rev_8_21_14_0_10_35_9]
MSSQAKPVIPKAFVYRRLHSLLGLLIVVYLMEHLIVNSQAALWLGDSGIGFIKLVNLIHSIPFLQVIEIALIGVPIFFHALLGIKYALTSKSNVRSSKGKKPCLKYERNIAYSWQRITSWILLLGIFVHVVHMRFLEKPKEAELNNVPQYLVKLNFDEGLYTLAYRLNIRLYNQAQIADMQNIKNEGFVTNKWTSPDSVPYSPLKEENVLQQQSLRDQQEFITTLSSYCLKDTQVVAASPSVGTAFLLMVRNVFKNPFWAIAYTLFVLSAAFHAFNGVWTAMITWGIILSYRSQKSMVKVAYGFMIIIAFLGLASIWGSYWINLRS